MMNIVVMVVVIVVTNGGYVEKKLRLMKEYEYYKGKKEISQHKNL